MSRHISSFLLLLFLNIGAGNELYAHAASQTSQQKGTSLARQVKDRDTGKDARLTLRMRLYDRQQRVRERALTMNLLKGGPGRPTPGDRTLLRFTYPNDIKGTALLVWEQPAADDERFLYLPALGRVRRIAGSEAQESFVGSDFTYEDIGGREFEAFSYNLLDRPNPSWKDAAGVVHQVQVLESRRLDASSRFPRVVSLVRSDNFVVVHAEIYNRRDEVQKVYEARRLEKVSGYWTVLDMVMTDRLQRTRSELVIEKMEYDVGLTADAFSRRELERGGS